MKNFIYANPTKIIFGKGMIANIASEIPLTSKVLMLYGGGSIKANGVYDQVMQTLKNHELTALYGLDHAQTLAIVLPGLLQVMKAQKAKKIRQLGKTIFNIHETNEDAQLDLTIQAIEQFFNSVGVKTHLSDYGLNAESIMPIVDRFKERGWKLGERENIAADQVNEILKLRL